MSVYRRQVLPRIQNKIMNTEVTRGIRSRVCAGLHGEVVEIGFGTGLNTAYYPADVAKVYAVEPSEVCMHIAEPRVTACEAAVEFAGLNGESLDLPSGHFDAVLSTWTLCTIPDMAAALEETRRVLRPNGVFHFVEHGRSPDAQVARWQARLEPLNKALLGGCHLTREIARDVEAAGFALEQIDTYYTKGDPRPFGYTFEGRAVKR